MRLSSLPIFLFSPPLLALFGGPQICVAQNTSANQSWSSATQQGDPQGAINPIRTSETHTELDGRAVDKTVVETLGLDGQYVLYSDTEKESVRLNDSTVRTVERSFGRGPDGQHTLIQQIQEDSSTLPGSEQKVVRTTSNPDANGTLQVVQRVLQDSKQLSPGMRETKTTVLTIDINGGLSPSAKIDERETKNSDGTVELKKSTSLTDGTGQWQLAEVRESTSKQENGQLQTKDERILRPDADGNLTVVEHTVSQQTQPGPGETRETTDTYSINVPGVAGQNGLQLVQRQTTLQQASTTAAQTTTRTERLNPGDPSYGLRPTEETIDIIHPGVNGVAGQRRTVLTSDPDGHLGQVWVDIGKTSDPAAVQVDTGSSSKPK
jgi:hypothetical protein